MIEEEKNRFREDAEARLRQEIDIAPGRIGPHVALFDLLAQSGRLEDALEAYEQASKWHPQRFAADRLLIEGRSRIFVQGGDIARASYGQHPRQYENAKILVIGLPKSGTVWLHQLLADCLEIPVQ